MAPTCGLSAILWAPPTRGHLQRSPAIYIFLRSSFPKKIAIHPNQGFVIHATPKQIPPFTSRAPSSVPPSFFFSCTMPSSPPACFTPLADDREEPDKKKQRLLELVSNGEGGSTVVLASASESEVSSSSQGSQGSAFRSASRRGGLAVPRGRTQVPSVLACMHSFRPYMFSSLPHLLYLLPFARAFGPYKCSFPVLAVPSPCSLSDLPCVHSFSPWYLSFLRHALVILLHVRMNALRLLRLVLNFQSTGKISSNYGRG